jgi:hypothetical protein
MPKPSEGQVALGGLFLFAFWVFVVLPFLVPLLGTSVFAQESAPPTCVKEHSAFYCFMQDQGGALGAVGTLLAVLAALGIALWQWSLENDRRRSEQLDLIRAIRIEAERLRMLATYRKQMVERMKPSHTLVDEQHVEAFKIYTAILREGRGASALPQGFKTKAMELIIKVDELNSIIESRSPFGILSYDDLESGLNPVIKIADELENQSAPK